METVTLLEISGCKAKGEPHPSGDLLVQWLKDLKCCKQIERSLKAGNKLSNEDVVFIKAFLRLPLSEAERIIFLDLLEMENGFDTKKVGTLDRFIDLKLARRQQKYNRIKATKYAFDERIQFILGI